MNAMANRMINAYGVVQHDVGIASASPHKLISMLYEGAIFTIASAKRHLEKGEVAERGAAISKAIAIIDQGLKISLDTKAGGELAENLHALYDYMTERLFQANLKSDVRALDEVEQLLRDLKGAWDQIGNLKPVAAPVEAVAPPPGRLAASYGSA